MRGEAIEGCADDQGVVGPELLGPKGRELRHRHQEPGAGEPARGPGEPTPGMAANDQRRLDESVSLGGSALPSPRQNGERE